MKKSSMVLIVILVEIFSQIISFVLAPLIEPLLNRWILISIIGSLLILSNFYAVYLLRKEHPAIWVIGLLFNFLTITIYCILDIPVINEGLAVYGIITASAVSEETMKTLPFFVDSFLYSLLLFSLREVFVLPVWVFSKGNVYYYKQGK